MRGKHSSPLRLFRLPCLPCLRLVVQFSSLTLLILGLKLVACLLLRSSSCEHESCHLLPSLDCVALLRWVLPSFSMSVFGHLLNFTIIRFTAPCGADFCFVLSFIGRHLLLLRTLSLMCPVRGRDTPCPCFGRSYFTDFAFCFSHCEGKASRFAENTAMEILLFAAQKGAASFRTLC